MALRGVVESPVFAAIENVQRPVIGAEDQPGVVGSQDRDRCGALDLAERQRGRFSQARAATAEMLDQGEQHFGVDVGGPL